MGYGEGAMVEVELEALKQEVDFFESSTIVRDCPIGKIEVDMVVKEN